MVGEHRNDQERQEQAPVDEEAKVSGPAPAEPAPAQPAPGPEADVDAPLPDAAAPSEPPAEADGEARAEGAAVPTEPADELSVALAEAERVRDEYLDYLRRERAAFENFRRRSTKERMDALDRGAEALVINLLGVLDTFGFALEAAEERDESDQLAKGVQLLHTELTGVLRRAGLEEVPGVGAPFDPVHHEAMLQVEAEQPTDEPVVVEVLRPGYRFKGRVLRPASVKVAK